jgi:hypothetical protein
MAKRSLKHQAEAAQRVHARLSQMTRDAVEQSAASRSPAARLYGANGPAGGPPRPSLLRGEPAQDQTLSAAQAARIEKASGPLGAQVMKVLMQAGFLPGGKGSQGGGAV